MFLADSLKDMINLALILMRFWSEISRMFSCFGVDYFKGKKYVSISVYLGSKLLFKQVLLKTMEHYLLFLTLFFQDSFLFFLCQDQDGNGIVPYLLPKRFRPYFWSSSGVV